MEYHVTIKGNDHLLPARTPEMDDLIARVESLRDLMREGSITRRQYREEQYDFVSVCTGEVLPPIDELDISELEISVLEILNAYLHPVVQAKIDAMMGTVREVTSRPELNQLFTVASDAKRSRVHVQKRPTHRR